MYPAVALFSNLLPCCSEPPLFLAPFPLDCCRKTIPSASTRFANKYPVPSKSAKSPATYRCYPVPAATSAFLLALKGESSSTVAFQPLRRASCRQLANSIRRRSGTSSTPTGTSIIPTATRSSTPQGPPFFLTKKPANVFLLPSTWNFSNFISPPHPQPPFPRAP